jgi:DNA-binding winged helix-turn-helix (wHTH) protein/tetratricopeptide (TPR) repeat protein
MPTHESDDPLVYRFGAFELNPRTRQLFRLGQPVAIQPKPFDLLLYLIRNRDRFVSRDELLARVWEGLHVDGEAIRFTVHAARKAVDDDGDRQSVIRTVPRAGFQLVAAVEAVTPSSVPARQGLPASPPPTPFLGREGIMEVIEALLKAAAHGEGRVLLLSGEAGIGKTRVIEQLACLADLRGARVLLGRCFESEGAPAFWPWVQILRAAVRSGPHGHPLRSLGAVAPEVAWMVPELRPLVAEAQSTPSDARTARFVMFDGVATFLKDLSSDGPCVLCIDDIHRADAASAALFQHVAREIGPPGGSRLLLVATYRDAELRMTPGIADPLTSLAALSHSRHEPLRGLAPDEVGTLIEMLSGHTPSRAVISDLHHKTNGNPFFLHQIIRVLESEHRLPELETTPTLDLELPRHIQDAVRYQLRLVPDRVLRLLEVASAFGVDFTITELEQTLDLDRDRVLSTIGFAIQASILEEQAGEFDRYRFVHALVRDAIYQGLAPEIRARHHARIAAALESRVPPEPGPECASIAYHHAHAATAGCIARSAHYYELAARWSSARGAFEDAVACLDRALALLEDAAPLAQVQRCRLLLHLGDALTNVGSRERARTVLRSAADIARRSGLREEAATAALRFAPDLLAIETGVFDPELVRILEEAIGLLGRELSPVRARLLARLAIAHQWDREQPDRSRRLCENAVRIASEARDADASEYVRTATSLIHFSLDPSERQVAPISVRDPSLEILQRVLRATSLLLLGKVDDIDAEIQRFSHLVDRSKNPQGRWYVDLMKSTRALMEGRFQDAARLAAGYFALGARIGDRNALHSFAVQTLMASFDVGGVEAHEPLLRDLVSSFPNIVGWRSGLVLFLAEVGRCEEARRLLSQVVADGDLQRAMPNEWYGVYAGLSLASGELDHQDAAAILYTALRPLAANLFVVGYSSYCGGSTHRLLAVLASVMREWDLARTHFEEAISRNASIGANACNGRVYFEYARMLFAAGDSTEAARRARQAEEIGLRFGMSRLIHRLEPYLR